MAIDTNELNSVMQSVIDDHKRVGLASKELSIFLSNEFKKALKENKDQHKDLVKAGSVTTKLLDMLSDNLKDTNSEIGKLSKQFIDFRSEIRETSEGFARNIKNFSDNYLKSIPIVGEKLSQAIGKTLDNNMGRLDTAFSKMLGSGGKTSVGRIAGFASFFLAIQGSVKIWQRIDGYMANISKNTGFSRSQFRGITDTLIANEKSLIKMGSSLYESGESLTAILNTFGSMQNVTGDMVMLAEEMRIAFNITAEESAQWMSNLNRGLGMTTEQSREFMDSFGKASQYGFSMQTITKDVMNNSNFLSLYLSRGRDSLQEMAMQARNMGVSLDTSTSLADGFLDVSSSIEKTTRLNAMLGSDLNGLSLQRLAWEGDILGVQEQIFSLVNKRGLLENQSYGLQKLVASELGISVEEALKLSKAYSLGKDELRKQSEQTMNMQRAIEEQKTAWEAITNSVKSVFMPMLTQISRIMESVGPVGTGIGIVGVASVLAAAVGVLSKRLYTMGTPSNPFFVKSVDLESVTGGKSKGKGGLGGKIMSLGKGSAKAGGIVGALTTFISVAQPFMAWASGKMSFWDFLIAALPAIGSGVGAGVGTFFGGPIGTLAGASIGNFLGETLQGSLTKNATGNVYNRPTLGLIGEEGRSEVVIPTERIRKGMPVKQSVANELASIGVPGFATGRAPRGARSSVVQAGSYMERRSRFADARKQRLQYEQTFKLQQQQIAQNERIIDENRRMHFERQAALETQRKKSFWAFGKGLVSWTKNSWKFLKDLNTMLVEDGLLSRNFIQELEDKFGETFADAIKFGKTIYDSYNTIKSTISEFKEASGFAGKTKVLLKGAGQFAMDALQGTEFGGKLGASKDMYDKYDKAFGGGLKGKIAGGTAAVLQWFKEPEAQDRDITVAEGLGASKTQSMFVTIVDGSGKEVKLGDGSGKESIEKSAKQSAEEIIENPVKGITDSIKKTLSNLNPLKGMKNPLKGLSNPLGGLTKGLGGGLSNLMGSFGMGGMMTPGVGQAMAAIGVGIAAFKGVKALSGWIKGWGKGAKIESSWHPKLLEHLYAQGAKPGDKIEKTEIKKINRQIFGKEHAPNTKDGFSKYDMKGREEMQDRMRTPEQSLQKSREIFSQDSKNNLQGGGGISGMMDRIKASGGQKEKTSKFQTGAIVTQKMRATVAEAGPEAIVPLSKLPSIIKDSGGGDNQELIKEFKELKMLLAQVVNRPIELKIDGYRLTKTVLNHAEHMARQ